MLGGNLHAEDRAHAGRMVSQEHGFPFYDAFAEVVLEGYIDPEETAPEGPFGDHTGYYNEVESFPVFTVESLMPDRAIGYSQQPVELFGVAWMPYYIVDSGGEMVELPAFGQE